MLDKLKAVEARYEEINRLLCEPETAANVEKTAALMKELKKITPVAESFRT